MSSKITDYLTKQVFIEKNVVTFRSLSRRFNIHVNAAKKELATFYANTQSSPERAYATYLLSGEAFAKPSATLNGSGTQGSSMDVDHEEEDELEEDDGEEVVPELRMTLAGEQDLETAKADYSRIYSEHIYSLSPSPVLDVGLLCGPSDAIYTADAQMEAAASVLLGRVTGPHVTVGKTIKSTTAHVREPRMMKPVVTAKPAEPVKAELSKVADDKVAPLKAKSSGKLDWSKAKAKVKAEESQPKIKVEEPAVQESERKRENPTGAKSNAPGMKDFFAKKPAKKEDTLPHIKETKPDRSQAKPPPAPAAKRGVKRKTALPVDSDSEPEPSSRDRSATPEKRKRPTYKIKGNAILSDEDEDEVPVPKPTRKSKTKVFMDIDLDDVPSNSERSLRAMMDIDDDQVDKVTRGRPVDKGPPTSDEEITDDDVFFEDMIEDVVMDEESDDLIEIEKPKRKRKPKKAVPIGENGLKKKRVVKSRMTTDAKGYMVMEDYSEYESVDEEKSEEPEEQVQKPQKPRKLKADAKNAAKKKAETKTEQDKEPRKIKQAPLKKTASSGGSKVVQKGSIMNFFGKK